MSAPDIAAIRARIADGVFLGGDYQVAYEQFLIAHRDRIALLARVDELAREHDTLVERSVGALAIAEGEEGHQKVWLDCPMLVAVASLRHDFEECFKQKEFAEHNWGLTQARAMQLEASRIDAVKLLRIISEAAHSRGIGVPLAAIDAFLDTLEVL